MIFNDFLKKFVWGASPGSTGCFYRATQTPNVGHPILNQIKITDLKRDLKTNQNQDFFKF
jgi:hypothetical protein